MMQLLEWLAFEGGMSMAKYTVEDIEILRKKSGITYEEAVNLLEYHNGSLARSLVDLEKNGRLKGDGGSAAAGKAKGLFNYFYRLRLKVLKGDVTIINLSVLFMVLMIFIAPHVLIIGLIASFLLGYRITGESNSAAFSVNQIDDMFQTVKNNVQSTVSSLSKQFSDKEEETGAAQETGGQRQARTETAPTGTTPVNVQFPQGGSASIREGDDGYHEADIQ